MINGKKILAIIPARGGSKGIPQKNIVNVDGKPLIYYTLQAAKDSKYIDEIHVSTDSIEIAKLVELYGVNVKRLRPEYIARDESRTIDVIIDVINFYKTENQKYDYIILLQPTQPLRNSSHIDEALEIFSAKNIKSLASVSPVEEHPILMREIDENGVLTSILRRNSTVRRQDFNEIYIVNGAIYINEIDELNHNTSLNDNKYPYIMDRKYHLDIDNYKDLELFREILKSHKNK